MKFFKSILKYILNLVYYFIPLITLLFSLAFLKPNGLNVINYGIIFFLILYILIPYISYYLTTTETKMDFLKYVDFYLKRDLVKSKYSEFIPNQDDFFWYLDAIPKFVCEELNIRKWGGMIHLICWMIIALFLILFIVKE